MDQANSSSSSIIKKLVLWAVGIIAAIGLIAGSIVFVAASTNVVINGNLTTSEGSSQDR